MTKEEHIQYWLRQVNSDWEAADALYKANLFVQSLFWAHLTLEKLCKALWVKKNVGNTPPLVHNLVKIAVQTGESFSVQELEFFSDMNTFQIKGRYPDYADNLAETVTREVCEEYLENTKKMMSCLQEKLQ